MQNDLNTIVLYDENGDESEFTVVAKFDIEESEYVIVTPAESTEDDIAIPLKIVKDEEGNELFETVENEQEFDMVAEAYNTLFAEEEN